MTNSLKFFLILLSSFFFFRCSSPPIPENIVLKKDYVWSVKGYEIKGSGFFISPNQLVTNFHVASSLFKPPKNLFEKTLSRLNFIGLQYIKINQNHNSKKLKVESIQHLDAVSDIAVFKIKGEVKNYLIFSNQNIDQSENFFMIGYYKEDSKIIALNKPYDEDAFLYFFSRPRSRLHRFTKGSPRILYGTSGSPILNQKGEVVAITVAFSQSRLFAIKSSILQKLLNEPPKTFSNSYQDIENEIKRLHQVAEQGSAQAQYELAIAYHKGRGVTADKEKAAYWLKKAIDQGHESASITKF